MPRWQRVAPVAMAVIAAATGGGWLLSHPGASSAAAASIPTAGASVRRMDVRERHTFTGTIGFAGAYAIVAPPGGSPGPNLAQARAALAAAQVAVATDRAAVADAVAIGAATDALAAGQPSEQLTLARDRQALHQAQAKLDTDTVALANARTAAEAGPGVVTHLPSVGDTIARGQALLEVDNRAVPLLLGDRPFSRPMGLGVSPGPDVAELQGNLRALGFGADNLGTAGEFNPSTAAAVRSWQASLGMAQTGTVQPGDAVVAATAVRVTALHAVLGATLAGGAPLLDATSTLAVINVPLDASSQTLVRVGDAVQVILPTGATTAGTVDTVGRVAISAASAGQGGPPRATVNVAITLTDPAAAGGLDQAPVTVGITNQRHEGVLAVPVNSLLALQEGGYAVKLLGGGRGRLVAVHTGLFSDDGMVEVTGQLREGDRVEVPKP